MKKRNSIMNRILPMVFCLILTLGAVEPLILRAEEKQEETVVRVGWYESTFNITGTYGERSGYSFVPMGNEKYYVYSDTLRSDISISDIQTMNGKRVGIDKNTIQVEFFKSWMEENGIDARVIVVNGFSQAQEKIRTGEIDCVVAPDLSYGLDSNLSASFCIGESDIYFAINKDRMDLKEELDEAMNQINTAKPYYTEELKRKYDLSPMANTLSREEIEWLGEHGKIRVAYLKDNLAFSDIDENTGNLIGALAEYIKYASNCLKNGTLEFEAIPYDSIGEEMDALKSGEVDVIFPLNKSLHYGEKEGILFSDTMLNTPMAAVTTQNNFNESAENTVAVAKDDIGLKWYLSSKYPKWEIIYCDNPDDYEKLLEDKKVDCFVTSAYRMLNCYNEKSFYCVYLSKSTSMSFVANRDETTLISVLNKTIRVMPDLLMNGALTMYANPVKKVTWKDFARDNFMDIALIMLAVFLGILIMVLVVLKKVKDAARKTTILNEQLQESHENLKMALVSAEHANEAKTIFLSNMSHDIRTPMNAIIGFTNIALKQDTNETVENCLKKISESSEHLLALINDVLDISRIESGKTKFAPAPVNICVVTESVLDIMQEFLNGRDLTFNVELNKLETPYVIADAVRIREVLVNILSNAVKYTNDGGSVTFATDYRKGESDGQIVVHYSVADTGVGMSKEFLGKIFDEFSQEESGARTQYKGTGLGMPIAKRYVEMMGGTISVESEKGVGTTVVVEIPMYFTSADNVQEQDLPVYIDVNGRKVLLAEDNDMNAEIATIQLEEYGIQVTRVNDGKEALDIFANNKEGCFDLILMDIMMPVMNGYEATRAIRAIKERPDAQTIPIIAMTANAFAEDVQASLDAGMNAHIAKPIVIEEVIKVISGNLKE